MAEENKGITMLQYLGLDYTNAIKSTDDFIKKLAELKAEFKNLENDLNFNNLNRRTSASTKAENIQLEQAKKKTAEIGKQINFLAEEVSLKGTIEKKDKDRLNILQKETQVLKGSIADEKALQKEKMAIVNEVARQKELDRQRDQAARIEQRQAIHEQKLEQEKLKAEKEELRKLEIQQNMEIREQKEKDRQADREARLEREAMARAEAARNKQLREEEKAARRLLLDEQAKENAIARATLIAKRAQQVETIAYNNKLNGQFVEQAQQYKRQAHELKEIYSTQVEITNEVRQQMELLDAQSKSLDNTVREELSNKQKGSSTLGAELKRRMDWFTSGTLYYGAINALKQGIKDISNIEMGMVEISRVMQDATFNAKEFRDQLMDLGQAYGFTFEDVQKIALRWAQSGYNVKDTLEATRSSLLALNVAELDAKQATESLIGIMNQWGLSASDLNLVIDKINKTADSFPVTSQDLVDGMLKASSAAKNMNVSFDETLGMLTAMKEASGATGKEVGNALKSIMAYIVRQDSIKTLEEAGITMFTDPKKTKFRSVLDIFDDIGKNWDKIGDKAQQALIKAADEAQIYNEEVATGLGLQKEWNDLQKRDISQASAGVFRRNYFISMIENIQTAKDVMNELTDVTGYSARENSQSMETQAKRVEQLKNAWQELMLTIGDSGVLELMKTVTSTANSLVGLLNKVPAPLVKTLGILASIRLVTSKTQALIRTIAPRSQRFFQDAGASLNLIGESLMRSIKGVQSLGKAFTDAGGVIKMSTGGWIGAIGAVLSVGAVIWQAYDYAKKKAEEARRKVDEDVVNSKKSLDELMETKTKYIKAMNEASKAGATPEDKQKLIDLEKQLSEQYKNMAFYIDDVGNKRIKGLDAIEREIELTEKQIKLNREIQTNTLEKERRNDLLDYEDAVNELERIEKSFDAYNARIEEARLKGRKTIEEYHRGQFASQLTKYQELEEKKAAIQQKYSEHRVSVVDEEIGKIEASGQKLSDKQKDYIKTMVLQMSSWKDSTVEIQRLVELFNSNVQSNWKGAEMMFDAQVAAERAKESIKNLSTAISEIPKEIKLGDFINEATKQFDEANEIIRDADGHMVALGASTRQVELETYRLSEEYDAIQGVIDEINNKHFVTDKNMQVLIKAYPELANATNLETDALIKLINATVGGKQDFIMAQINMTDYASTESGKRIMMLGEELQKWLEFYDGMSAISSASGARGIASGLGTTGHALGIGDDVYLNNAQLSPHAKSLMSEMNALKKNVKDSVRNISENLTRAGQSISKTGSAAKSASRGASSAQKEHNKALEDAIKLIDNRKKLEEETFATAKRDWDELISIKKNYAKTEQEILDMDIRIYEAEKKYNSLRLKFSKDWIDEQKRMRIMNTQEEIEAWERIKSNQANNIDAIKEAETQLYELRKRLREENLAEEERYLNHRKNVHLLSIDEEIDAYERMYKAYPSQTREEQYTRIENLYGLYHSKIDELFKDIDDRHQRTIKGLESSYKSNPIYSEIDRLDEVKKRLQAEQRQAKEQKNLEETAKRLRELRDEAKALGMDTVGLFRELPYEYLKLLDGELTYDERLKKSHEARIKFLEEEAKIKGDLIQQQIDDIDKQIKALEELEKAEKKQNEIAKLKEEIAYWSVRTSEEARKKVKELTEKLAQLELDDTRQKEKDKLKAKSDSLKQEQKDIDKGFKDKKKLLEDEYNIEKKIRDEIRKLNRDEAEDRIRYQLDMLESRRSALIEEKEMIEQRAKEEIEQKQAQYQQLTSMFTDHMKNVIALSGSLSKEAYQEWVKNYIVPMQQALDRGDYSSALDYGRRAEGAIEDYDKQNRDYYRRENHDARGSNREIYQLAERIVQLKYEWDMYHKNGNDKAAERAHKEAEELRRKLARLNSTLARQLAESNYYQAMQILARLPKMHKGGKTLSYGAVYMKPGELVFPPNLSKQMEQLIGILGGAKLGANNYIQRNINFESVIKTDSIDFNDRRQQEEAEKRIIKKIKQL